MQKKKIVVSNIEFSNLSHCTVEGNNNVFLSCFFCKIKGNQNHIQGKKNQIYGDKNHCKGSWNRVYGNHNIIDGNHNCAHGMNLCRGKHCFIVKSNPKCFRIRDSFHTSPYFIHPFASFSEPHLDTIIDLSIE